VFPSTISALKKLFLRLALACCFCLAGHTAHAASPTNEAAARAAAEEWLTPVDGKKFVENWQRLDPAFAKKVGKKSGRRP